MLMAFDFHSTAISIERQRAGDATQLSWTEMIFALVVGGDFSQTGSTQVRPNIFEAAIDNHESNKLKLDYLEV